MPPLRRNAIAPLVFAVAAASLLFAAPQARAEKLSSGSKLAQQRNVSQGQPKQTTTNQPTQKQESGNPNDQKGQAPTKQESGNPNDQNGETPKQDLGKPSDQQGQNKTEIPTNNRDKTRNRVINEQVGSNGIKAPMIKLDQTKIIQITNRAKIHKTQTQILTGRRAKCCTG